MLNEAQSKVRNTEGKWMGNQCALHTVTTRPGPRMHDLAYERFCYHHSTGEETEFQRSGNLPSLYKANFPPPHHMLHSYDACNSESLPSCASCSFHSAGVPAGKTSDTRPQPAL